MRFIAKYKNYNLKLREKFNKPCHRQIIRSIKMLSKYPLRSINSGFLKAMINLTYECHCGCDYCWCGIYDRYPGQEFSSLEVRRILDEIAEYPSVFTVVSFMGGEPLLRGDIDIYELITYAAKKGLFTEMETNGILLSRPVILKLRNSGLNHLFVKIEGSNAEKHDSLMKVEGCFEKAINGIKIFVKEKLSCSIFMNASKEKIKQGELSKIINIGRKLKVNSVRIIYPTLAGRWVNRVEKRLTTEQKEEVKRLLQPDFVYLESTDAIGKENDRLCAALNKKFFLISCYGEVLPCPYIPISFGNLRSKSLSEILHLMWAHPIFNAGYIGCPMNNSDFRGQYILPARLDISYRIINL